MTRMTLPQRRHAEVFEFVHEGIAFRASISRFGEVLTGPIAETFLDGGKPGSAVQALARDCAVATSIALQYGAPLDVLRNAMTRIDAERAAGPMGALLDEIVRGGQ